MADERTMELEASLQQEKEKSEELKEENIRKEEELRNQEERQREAERLRETEMADERRRRVIALLVLVAINKRLNRHGLYAKQGLVHIPGEYAIDIGLLNPVKDKEKSSFLSLKGMKFPNEILSKLKGEKNLSTENGFKDKVLSAHKDMTTDFALLDELDEYSKELGSKSLSKDKKSLDRKDKIPKFSLKKDENKTINLKDKRSHSREDRDFQREKPSVAGGYGGFK